MKNPDQLTSPEYRCENRTRKRIRSQVMERGGCGMCIHRNKSVDWFGRSICAHSTSREFPACMKDGRKPRFELDGETLQVSK